MPYTQEISRSFPTLILFLIDQSGSMVETWSGTNKSKSIIVAKVINDLLNELGLACTFGVDLRRYFDVGAITYGDDARSALDSSVDEWIGIDLLIPNPRNLEAVEQFDADPIWITPISSGLTPMCASFRKAKSMLINWIDKNPNSYPPTIFNITDGDSSDGDPSILAEEIKRLRTSDGHVLLFNIHISSCEGESIFLPESSSNFPDDNARRLFEMSSNIPSSLIERCQQSEYKNISFKSKAFAFNAGMNDFRKMLDLGTPVEM